MENKIPPLFNNLVRLLNQACETQPFRVSWYLYDIRSGNEAAYNGDALMVASSIRKVFIMMSAFAAATKGLLDLEADIQLNHKQVEQSEVSGCLQFLRPGFSLSIRDLIILMIIVSDNVAAPTIVNQLGLEAINTYCRAIGLLNTVHRSSTPIPGIPRDYPIEQMNTTTANDVGLVLKKMFKGANNAQIASELGCTSEFCAAALKILSGQQGSTQFPTLLPPEDAQVGHKHGYGIRSCGDVGIFYRGTEPRFILAALVDDIPQWIGTQLSGHAVATDLTARLAKITWDSLGTVD